MDIRVRKGVISALAQWDGKARRSASQPDLLGQ